MSPYSFDEVDRVYAKDQPEYQPLPAWSDDQETRTAWRLTWVERFTVLFKGTLWLRQLNYGQPL